MALFKAKALYDFAGEANTAEITISAGEVLTVTRIDIGEGWWEGLNAKGESGLFPEAYVERISDSKPPNMPAPQLPPQPDWGGSVEHQEDDWDDEWDNEDTYSEINPQKETFYSNEPNQNQMGFGGGNMDNMSESNFSIDSKGTVTKKSLNRFSSYVKSGLESYIAGTLKDVSSSGKVHIFKDNDLIRWEVISNPYTVQVTSPKKSTKMGGLKSFIAYQLTPSFTGIEVSRRYKHFDWLHNRLTEKFNVIAIPPLPDKQISGRYEDQFVEHRRVQLQEFVSYVCRHPVLSTCDVWHHFLTCTDEKQWKQGKRNAERDQLIGANFCLCIEAPDKELLPSTIDSKLDLSNNYINQMDQNIKALMQIAVEQQKKCVAMYKREYTKVGECFFSLGSAFEISERGMFTDLSTDVKRIGTTYVTIAKLFEDQAKIDWQPLADKLYLYKGVTSSFPDMFQLQKHAEQKKKEVERNGQMQHVQINDVRKRTDVLTYTVFAELDHFQNEMQTELKSTMKQFLQEQVNFYKNIVVKLEETLNRFE